MKKSKSKSKRRDRSRSRSSDSKSKRQKPRSKSPSEKEKAKTKTTPRKTRWQADDKKDSSKKDQPSETVSKQEKSGPPLRIKDCLHNKEKIVDILFETVTGAALQELIPDYLKKRSKEELKKLCLREIKNMSDEVILKTITGELKSSNKDEEKKIEKEENLKLEQPSVPTEDVKAKKSEAEKKSEEKPELKEKSLNTVPKPETTNTKEKEVAEVEENKIPLIIKDEVAKDLILPERDAELLELEMRARAIRSLLKAKNQAGNEDEAASKDN